MYLFHQQIKIYTPYIRHTVKINVGRTHRSTFALRRYYGGRGAEPPAGKNGLCYKKSYINLQYTDSSDTWFQDLKMYLKGGLLFHRIFKTKKFPLKWGGIINRSNVLVIH